MFEITFLPCCRVSVKLLVPRGQTSPRLFCCAIQGQHKPCVPGCVLGWCLPLVAPSAKPCMCYSASVFFSAATCLNVGAAPNPAPTAMSWDSLCVCGKGKGGLSFWGMGPGSSLLCRSALDNVKALVWVYMANKPVSAVGGFRWKRAQGCRLRAQSQEPFLK